MSYMDMPLARNGEELRAYCEAGRDEHNPAGDSIAAYAHSLQAALRRSVPNGAFSSALIAARVARHLKTAADLQKTSAQAFMRCWYRYEELVKNPQMGSAPFDITK